MASLQKKYTEPKLLGQVYTPFYIVNKILTDIGYRNKSILGKSILDPACGDGRFLIEVVNEIIKNSNIENLKHNLSFVYGWDIDDEAINACIINLNKIIEPYNIYIEWNIYNCDSIYKLENINSIFQTEGKQFDFIVGNPPYIRIQHLEEVQRKYIQKRFTFCKNGSTDIYIAFFELAYHLLKDSGIASYITPNTFFYTETANIFRNYFANKQCIRQITNYAEIQLFDNATTYSAITIFSKKKYNSIFFERAIDNKNFISRQIDYTEIQNSRIWSLGINIPILKNKDQVLLKNICKIHVGITTLCDKAYIFEIEDIDENFVLAKTYYKGNIKIEKGIIKPIIKASKFKSNNDTISKYIVFPYEQVDGKHKIIDEKIFQNKYPLCYEYLLSLKEDFLDKRDNGKKNTVSWFAFGRSQGLDSSFGKKILFSPISKLPNFIYTDNEDATFYSGYCIKYDKDMNNLLSLLNSEDMKNFIEISSRDFKGGWKAYSKKAIEDFPIVLL